MIKLKKLNLRKYNVWYLFLYIIYFSFLIPDSIEYLVSWWKPISILLRGLGCLIAIVYVINVKNISNSIMWLSAYIIYLGINTFTQNGSISRFFLMYSNIWGAFVLTEMLLHIDTNLYLQRMSKIMLVGLFINIISVLAFPQGMIIVYNALSGYVPYWFYDSDHRFIVKYFPTLIILYANNYVQEKKQISTWLALLGMVFSLVYTWSVGAMVSFLVIAICWYVFLKKNHSIYLNIYLINTSYIIAWVAVVICNIYIYFEWLIVGVLKKTMTLSYRTYIWDKAIKMIKDASVFGHGVLSYFDSIAKFGFVHCHSQLLNVLLWSGGVGLLIYMFFLFNIARNVHIYRQCDISKFTSILLIALYIASLVDCLDFSNIYILFAIIGNLNLIIKRKEMIML